MNHCKSIIIGDNWLGQKKEEYIMYICVQVEEIDV